jgi:glycerol-3-phosphate dehydrogenase
MIETDILIIGAGVVGASIARELSRYELQILIVEKEVDVAFGTSKANSGILHSGIHDLPGSLKAQLCVRGNTLYPKIVEELNVSYKNNGQIIVARSPEELPILKKLVQQGRTNGITGFSELSKEELLQLEPNLSTNLAGGVFVESAGIVIPFDLVFALTENAIANGVQLAIQTKVLNIVYDKKQFLVTTNRGIFKTKKIINAAGLNGAKIAALIGDDSITIHPRKGEEYILDRKLEGLVKRTIFPLPSENSKGILIIPTTEGNIMLGPTAQEVNDSTDLTTTAAGWQEIFPEVKSLMPSLKATDLITSFAGLRASGNTDDFIIAHSPVSRQFINVVGIDSPGLTAAPAIAEYVIELLQETGLQLKEKKVFNPYRRLIRMQTLTREEQEILMKKDPAYSRIVCRCEQISEGEIRAAIRRGATTLDGVKLRTRSGMGRCQGGFCTQKIITLLCEELNILPWEVTKNGPGSEVLTRSLRNK